MPEDPSEGKVEEGAGIDSLERDKSQLIGRISKISKELGEIVDRVGQEANHVANKVSDEANAVINYHRSVSRKIVETVNREEMSVRGTVFSLASSLDYFLWVVAGLLVGFGVVVGYFVFRLSVVYLGIFSIPWIIGGIGVLHILRSKVSALRSQTNDLAQVKDMQEEMTEMVASLPQPQPDVKVFEDRTKTLSNAVTDLTKATSQLVTVDARLVKLKAREEFVKSFIVALNRYGFQSKEKDFDQRFTKCLVGVDEPSWLDSVLTESKHILNGVPVSILKLVFLDSQRYQNEVDQSWETIKKIPSLRIQLANLLIRNGLVAGPNVNDSFVSALSELLVNLQTYSLDLVKVEAAVFLEQVASFKVDAVNYLAVFDLKIVEDVVELMAFMPKSCSIERWRNEVLEYIATTMLQLDVNFVELLVRHAIGDASKRKYWRVILRSNNLSGFATILGKKRLAPLHSEFDQAVYQRHLLLAMQSFQEDFSLQEIERSLRILENTILEVERNLRRTARLYRLDLNDFSYVRSFIPTSIATTEQELIAVSAQHALIKPKIFEFLYLSAVGSDKCTKLFLNIIGDDAAARLLVDFLVSSDFIPKGPFNKFAVSLLKSHKSFEMTNFVSVYTLYERLFQNSENLWSFLRKKECCEKTKALGFDDVLKLCTLDSSQTEEERLVLISEKLLINKFGKRELTKDQIEQVALVVTMLYLSESRDPRYKSLCERIGMKLFASRVLYKYTHVVEDCIATRKEPTLDIAIAEALEQLSDDSHFMYFKLQLGSGKFIGRASDVINSRLAEITIQIKRLRKEGFDLKLLDSFVTPLRHLLYDSLNLETLRVMLNTHILSAYILTIPANHMMNTIIDSTDFLESSANALALKAGNKYEGLIRLSRPTRIGLIPLEMSFESFGTKFEDALRGAVKMYSTKSQHVNLSEFRTFYISRILPSTFVHKEISSTGESQKTLEMIRILARTSMTGPECLTLLSLLQPVDRSEAAIRSIIEAVIDSSELKLFYSDIDKNHEIQSKFADHTLDGALMSAYNVSKLSSLCKVIEEQLESAGEERAKKRFYDVLRETLPRELKLTPYKEELFVRTLFKRMSSLGAALRS